MSRQLIIVLVLGLLRPAMAFDVAVTLDDLPFLGSLGPKDTKAAATSRILAALKKHGVPATGFVVCQNIGQGAPIINLWLQAGLELGNHSTTHPHLDQLSPEDWEKDVFSCQERLQGLVGRPIGWFRYPFLQMGRTPERRDQALALLRRRGHRVAQVSVDTGEWVLVKPYGEALRSGSRERQEAIGQAFVEHVTGAMDHYRAVARERLGREVAQVLLLHAHALAADHLDALLAAITAQGGRYVPLDQALADPAYTMTDAYAGPVGLSWLYRMAPATGEAWAWDDGQVKALERRFGAADKDPYSIDRHLTIRPLTPRAWVVVHERPWPANALLVEMEDSTLVLVDTPYTPQAGVGLLSWIRARFGRRPLVAINTHFHQDALGANGALIKEGVAVHGSDLTVRLLAERGEAMREVTLGWLKGQPEEALFRGIFRPTGCSLSPRGWSCPLGATG